MVKKSTVSKQEIAHFDAIASEWWDRDGKYKILHKLNPIRIEYIKRLCGDLSGKTVLDVGCGGGLVSFPLARLGAQVTAIDASLENIKVARVYAQSQELDVAFIHSPVEELNTNDFDIIVALEIIEHVEEPEAFVSELASKLKKGGTLIMSTINRNIKSMLFAKIAAEYILGIVPIGTHSYSKFITPEELESMATAVGLEKIDEAGLELSMPYFEFSLSDDMSINYFMSFTKL